MKTYLILLFLLVAPMVNYAAGERKFTAAEDKFLKEFAKELDGKTKRNEPGKRDIRIGSYVPESVVRLTLTVLDAENETVEIEEPWFLVQEGEKSIATILRVSGTRLVVSYDDDLKMLICMTLSE